MQESCFGIETTPDMDGWRLPPPAWTLAGVSPGAISTGTCLVLVIDDFEFDDHAVLVAKWPTGNGEGAFDHHCVEYS